MRESKVLLTRLICRSCCSKRSRRICSSNSGMLQTSSAAGVEAMLSAGGALSTSRRELVIGAVQVCRLRDQVLSAVIESRDCVEFSRGIGTAYDVVCPRRETRACSHM